MPNLTCNTCFRPLDKPFRIHDEGGKIVHGCVAADHTNYLISDSDDCKWHNRPQAAVIREAVRIHLEKIFTSTGA